MPMVFPDFPDAFATLPFRVRSVGVRHAQEPVHRPQGYPHHHWIQVRRGRCRLELATGVEHASAGDGLYLRPAEFHAYRSADPAGLVVDWLTFDGPGVDQALAAGPLQRSGVYRLEGASGVVATVAGAFRLAGERAPGGSRRLSVYAYRLLMELAVAASAPGGERTADASRRLVPALDLARTRLREHVGVAEMAQVLGVSTQHLGRLFRARLGLSPAEYLIRLRLDRARGLLLDRPELRVHEIAVSAGYRDVNYFCRLFRSREGCSPGQFRQLHGR